jgi:CHAD domain-containing protein
VGNRVAETERTYLPAQERAAGDVHGHDPPPTPDPAGLPDVDGLPGVAEVRAMEPIDLDATYFDTDDLRLAAHRITLRRRTGGDDAGWHLKLPTTDADTRTEVHAHLDSGTERTVPKSLSTEVAVHTRGRPLRQVARIVNHRSRTRLLADDGTALAEIAHDQVTVGDLRWTEIEAELLNGEPPLLDAVEERLLAAGLRRSPEPSKLRHALGDRVPAPPRPPAETDSAGHAVWTHLRRRIGDLIAQDPLVMRDEPDAVHQMRVATRRLRAALRTYRRELDRATTDTIGDELKWLAGVLGEERDREVLHERLTALLDQVPEARAAAPRLRHRVSAGVAHARARAKLRRRLRGERYFALLDRLDALLADPPLRPPAARPADEALTAAVRREHRRLARRIRHALALPPGADRDVALHEARKAAKRARYAAESALPVLGGPARRHRERLTELQRLLGEHQDSVMCRAEIARLAHDARAAGEDTFGYGALHHAEYVRAAAVEAELPAAWRKADKGRLAR